MLLSRPAFVLERRINHPLPEVGSGLHTFVSLGLDADVVLGRTGMLQIDSRLRPSLVWYSLAWRADGRLLNERGRLVARVEIEVDAWSHDATRLQLRPCASHPERWSGRRLRRYFALAHQAADHTARRLDRLAAVADPEWLTHELVAAVRAD